jgi:16S rRNA (guanine966-N2)-methyltransferase
MLPVVLPGLTMSADMASNEVRIIGGLWKGRKLRFTATADLRPSLGRVRETLFNWLAADIDGTRCLDLFAGSGALGFEALSRGATSVTFVERNRKAALALRENARQLGTQKAHVVQLPAERFLKTSPEQTWDIIFFDPPFADKTAAALLPYLRQRLSSSGRIYLEGPKREPLPFAEQLIKYRQAGDCHFGLLDAGAAQYPAP